MSVIDDLTKKFEEAENRRRLFERAGAVNIYGQTPQDRVKIDLQYQQARNEYEESLRDYRDALRAAAKDELRQ